MSRVKKKSPDELPGSQKSAPPFGEPVVVPIEDSIDLHPFSPKDIPSVVEEYLEQCLRQGLYEVRIIHGKGSGIQRRILRSLLEKHPRVKALKDASPEAGGWGATVVILQPPNAEVSSG